jgi:putative transposase
MHRTLKLESTDKSVGNLLQQQEKFDNLREELNYQRPHQAIGMKQPADI